MPDTRKEKLMAALEALDDESEAHEKAEKDEDEGKKKPKRKKPKLYEMMQ